MRQWSNQPTKLSRKNGTKKRYDPGLIGAALGGLVGAFFGFAPGSSSGLPSTVMSLLIVGLACLIGALLGIMNLFLWHFVLRLWLWCTGSLPWNLVAFLDEATVFLIMMTLPTLLLTILPTTDRVMAKC